MVPQTITTSGIATIKPKRKYTKRKPSITLVKPKVRKELPKTARAYLSTLGMKADKEGTAVTELIKLHNELVNKEPEYKTIALNPAPVEPVSFWKRWFGK
jgi:hypothetical protein